MLDTAGIEGIRGELREQLGNRANLGLVNHHAAIHNAHCGGPTTPALGTSLHRRGGGPGRNSGSPSRPVHTPDYDYINNEHASGSLRLIEITAAAPNSVDAGAN